MSQKVTKPIEDLTPVRVLKYECPVCGGLFDSEEKARPEFNPLDPFPKDTRVRFKRNGRLGVVVMSEIVTDRKHRYHDREIVVRYDDGGEDYFYVSQDKDESAQLELLE